MPQNQSFHGFQSDRQDDTLQVFYQRLSYFLMTGEHSSKEIMEEIERQISNLQQKVSKFQHTLSKLSYSSDNIIKLMRLLIEKSGMLHLMSMVLAYWTINSQSPESSYGHCLTKK